MLILYISSGPLLKRKGIKILHSNGFIMIVGIIFTLLIKCLNPNSNFFKGFQFSDTIFFTFKMKQYEESFIKKIEDYDRQNILPKMIINWHDVVDNINNKSKIIKIALGEWAENKEKNNIYKNTDTIGFEMPGFYNQNLRIDKEDKKQKTEMKEFYGKTPYE